MNLLPQFSPGYRADVDGLRALAVLAVILYHAGVPGFHGGYVGVDVFFVISGFLLFRPFVARQLEAKPPLRVRTYLRRRVLRVIPGYWFALTAFAAWILVMTVLLLRAARRQASVTAT